MIFPSGARRNARCRKARPLLACFALLAFLAGATILIRRIPAGIAAVTAQTEDFIQHTQFYHNVESRIMHIRNETLHAISALESQLPTPTAPNARMATTFSDNNWQNPIPERDIVWLNGDSGASVPRSFRIAVHPSGWDKVSDQIRFKHTWEPELLQSVTREFPVIATDAAPAMRRLFVDVGGNVGFFGLHVAARGHRVIAFEPFPRNVRLLRRSASFLNAQFGPLPGDSMHPRYQLIEKALGAKAGDRMCVFQQGTHNNGNGRLMPAFEGVKDFGWDSKGRRCEDRVTTARLDEALLLNDPEMPRIWGLKIDVEGFEAMVLRGFQGFMSVPSRRPCHIWFEFAHEWVEQSGASRTEIFELLDSTGYLLFKQSRHDGNVEAHLQDPACAFSKAAGLPTWTPFPQDHISWRPSQRGWTGR